MYVISVQCKNICSWEVRRRYSEFDAFMTQLKKVVPVLNKEEYQLPPKVIFNKMAESVVSHRTPALNSFLEATIKNCKSYGTAEQNTIFAFLDAYENILRQVCGSEEERALLESAGEASIVESNENDKANVGSGGKSTAIDNSWQTSFAAAVITAWLLMLSFGMEGTIA